MIESAMIESAMGTDTSDAAGCEVQVWRAVVPEGPPPAPVARLLSPEERLRFGRFHRSLDATRFAVGRALVRTAVGRALGTEPESVVLDRVCRRCGGPHGPPHLAGPSPPLALSVSRGGDVVLCAVGPVAELGVDLEPVSSAGRLDGVERTVLDADDLRLLHDLPEDQRAVAVLTGFVRKEAYLKAIGTGLALPLTSCRVTFRPGEEPAVQSVPPGEIAADRWTIVELAVDGHVAALVARDGPVATRMGDAALLGLGLADPGHR